MLNHFRLMKYTLHLRARETIFLPRYKGATFRGAFGSTFKRICCSTREKECARCLVKEHCPYAYVFETSPPPGSEALRKLREVPRPFVIEPDLSRQQKYTPDEEMGLGLVLVGKAMDLLPYFILAFRELGSLGIGTGRGKYELERIEAVRAGGEGDPVYTCQDQMVRVVNAVIGWKEAAGRASRLPQDRVALRFLTPARLKSGGTLDAEPSFGVFVQRLLERLSSLSYFHCGKALDVDFKGMIERARAVETVQADLSWDDWERYSKRQKATMRLGGVVGEISYAGALREFLPFLVLGEYVHVGKGATFGLGRYALSDGAGLEADRGGKIVLHEGESGL